MKINKRKRAELLLPIGLLMITVPFWLKKFVPLEDWLQGFIMGVGMGLEIVAIMYFVKAGKKGREA